MDIITLIVIIVVLGCCIYWASPPGAPPIVAWGIRAIFIVIAIIVLLGFIGVGPGDIAFHGFHDRYYRR
jgi:hypothetical protein